MLRKDIDRDILIQIIEENQECVVDFWGSYSLDQANIGGGLDGDTNRFIEHLSISKNVKMHGAILAPELAIALKEIDF